MAKVYIQVDANNNITTVNSDIFISDFSNWIYIDEGYSDKYSHAQGNYFENGICTMTGVYRYQWIDGEIYEKTPEEIEAETVVPAYQPTLEERISATESALLTLMEMGVL